MRPDRRAARRADGRAHPFRHSQEPRAAGRRRRRFREDLFYRINVIEMRVPALRERAEDIPELADAIVRRLARRLGMDAAAHRRRRRSRRCRSSRFPATCASSRTCSSARWRCATRGASTSATCSCARCHASRTRRRCRADDIAQLRTAVHLTARRRRDAQARGARRAARRHRARCHRQGAGEDPLQQDRRREGLGHDVSRAALSDQEARNRVTQSDTQRHFVTWRSRRRAE